MTHFERYLGIDYSGAQTAESSLPGLALYTATPDQPPVEIPPPLSPRKYWTRRGLAQWLATELREGPASLVGIDHAFSFPLRYFETHHLLPDWPGFLDDIQKHWPTDRENTKVDDIRHGLCGNGAARTGNSRWRRLTEQRSSAKSVFHFDVPGSVAKSSHAGIPWLRYLRRQCPQLHFWPFDGWTPPNGSSVIVEAYPALYNKTYPKKGRTPHQHDAYSVARWMRECDAVGTITDYFQPELNPAERALAQVEGWIFGLA